MSSLHLALDTDALAVLLALDCLDESLDCLGISKDNCRRLTPAPIQFRRARWAKKQLSPEDRERMASVAEGIAPLSSSGVPVDLDLLSSVTNMDEGEAVLLSAAASLNTLLVLSGDGRMLRALAQASKLADLRERLKGRIIYLPQIIGVLGTAMPLEDLDQRWRRASLENKTLSIIFGTTGPVRREDFLAGIRYSVDSVAEDLGEDFLRVLDAIPGT